MPTRAVIFDLYGTLVKSPSMDVRRALLAEMAAAMDIPHDAFVGAWMEGFWERQVGFFGTEEGHLEHIARRVGVAPDPQRVARAAEVALTFDRESLQSTRADALDTLRALKDAGLRLGLVSNCGVGIPKVWDECSMAPFIDAPVFSSTARLKKPDPRIYQLALQGLGAAPEDTLYVADGMDDELTGARNVGIAPILLQSPDEDAHDERRAEGMAWTGTTIECLREVLGFVV